MTFTDYTESGLAVLAVAGLMGGALSGALAVLMTLFYGRHRS